ncbi:MAG: MqnA/MqnD/SBP family protein [Acidobacteriota bacterium]|nr:MqnA/MqnD/SBP family protein [Acidobacteriota bacterium]MDQ7086922.1 MqnA/MqnD/SBP family protein [Acidobacteriota bacterium]
MKRLRVGVSTFLETRPLSWGLDLPPWNERFAVTSFEDPRQAAGALDAGSLDLALLPPDLLAPRAGRLEIVPGLAVTSRGGCGVARLLYQPPLGRIGTVGSSCPGHGAESLLALLFAASGRTVTFDETSRQARLVTLGSGEEPPGADHRVLDLSTAWWELTGLPMVWWTWAARPAVVTRDVYGILHNARTRGRHDLQRHLRQWLPHKPEQHQSVATTFEEKIRLRLGNDEMASLRRLWQELESLALVPVAGAPRLLSFGKRGLCGPAPGSGNASRPRN